MIFGKIVLSCAWSQRLGKPVSASVISVSINPMELIRVNQYISTWSQLSGYRKNNFCFEYQGYQIYSWTLSLKMKFSDIDNFAWVFVVYFLAKIGQDLVEGFAVE